MRSLQRNLGKRSFLNIGLDFNPYNTSPLLITPTSSLSAAVPATPATPATPANPQPGDSFTSIYNFDPKLADPTIGWNNVGAYTDENLPLSSFDGSKLYLSDIYDYDRVAAEDKQRVAQDQKAAQKWLEANAKQMEDAIAIIMKTLLGMFGRLGANVAGGNTPGTNAATPTPAPTT